MRWFLSCLLERGIKQVISKIFLVANIVNKTNPPNSIFRFNSTFQLLCEIKNMNFLSKKQPRRTFFEIYFSEVVGNVLNTLFLDFVPSVVTCACNPATLKAEFWNSVGSIQIGGNSPSIGGWIVWPSLIQRWKGIKI